MARALKVPGNRLRLRTPPDSGGSFGVKQAIFPYIVLIAVAARVAGRPVKWIEDRLEHLGASVSATNRVTTLEAAVDGDGRIAALACDQIEDCGAHLRAPEPATLYRMHGNLTGAYDIRHVEVRNRVVLTNKTPTGLNRGFGGPQIYYRAGAADAAHRRRAVARSARGHPPQSRARQGLALPDSDRRVCSIPEIIGATLDAALSDGGLDALRARRDAARAPGPDLRHRLCGGGRAERLQYGLHHRGADAGGTPPRRAEERRPGHRDRRLDPLGAVSVHVASTPQGQGHRTVLAQVVADVLGLKPQDVRVNAEVDTAQGRLVDRIGQLFQPLCAGRRRRRAYCGDAAARPARAHRRRAAQRIPGGDRVRRRAHCARAPTRTTPSPSRGSPPPDTGRRARSPPSSVRPSARPSSGRRPSSPRRPKPTRSTARSVTASSSISAASKSIAISGAVRIDNYVTMHDCGRILHPGDGRRPDHRRLCPSARRRAL